jgi:hypothetical protein
MPGATGQQTATPGVVASDTPTAHAASLVWLGVSNESGELGTGER